jgi:hypothetical protein
MSRAQQGQVYSTGQAENKQLDANSNSSFTTAQNDINSYGQELNQFKANNPYVQGGSVQTAQNQELADTAAAGSASAGQAIQGAAVRTGQNPGGAIAATEQIEQNNQRTLGGEEANATVQRAGADAGYNETALGGAGNIVGMEDKIADQQGDLAAGAMSEEEKAAQTPSFLDELGQGVIQAGDNFAGGFGQAIGKAAGGCWIAAAVFAEDFATGEKTNLVRSWLWNEWVKHWYAKPILWIYSRFGESASRSRLIVKLLRPWFEKALSKAVKLG